MADYKELWALRDENDRLTETNRLLKDELINLLDKLADPETREKIISLADALIGGKPVITSGGGGGSDSDFRWDGRRPEEEELINRESAFRECQTACAERSDVTSQSGTRCIAKCPTSKCLPKKMSSCSSKIYSSSF